MIYKDIIINYFISDIQGVRQAISFDSYREHASSGAYLVKYESRVNDVTADLKERHIMKDDKEFLCTEVYGSTKDGVAMGVLTNEGNVLFRTFVTYDMLKGDQIETFTRNEQIRREIHDS